MNKITVIIPTFNREKFLGECLDSIFDQTFKAFQIIVVNDGSTDKTAEICKSYGHRIEYYELQQVGKPVALNFALSKVKGDYIWIFDDDDVALPDALERLIEPLMNNLGYGFSFSPFYYTDTNPNNDRIGSIRYELKIPDLNTRGFLIPLLQANFLGGAALFARTSCYKEVGGFDTQLLRSQDYEMAIRLARRYKGVRVRGGSTFHYRQHDGLRGALNDRFSIQDRQDKWDKYTRTFFRRLYHEISLQEYLPPGRDLIANMRQAILQRIAIMCTKELLPEISMDLQNLMRVDDLSPITKEEYEIIRDMIIPSYHGGRIFNHFDFFREISRVAPYSPVVRLLRKKILRAIMARYRYNSKSKIKEIPQFVNRMVSLYFN